MRTLRFGPTVAVVARALLVPLALASTLAHAGAYPDGPISIVVSYAPGGVADIAVRTVAAGMAERLGQPVIVQNRPGASGTIGADYVARARPDGYTLGAVGTATGVIPHLIGPVPPYGPGDFAYVGQIAYTAFVLVARQGFPPDTIDQLRRYSGPGADGPSYGESGPATRLAAEWLWHTAGIRAMRVPYKGDAPALADLAGGHIDMAMVSLSSAMPHIEAGAVKALAVTSPGRSPALPAVPAVAEAIRGYEAGGPTMLAAPGGTPPGVIDRLNAALNDTLADSTLAQRFASLGLGIGRLAPVQAKQTMRDEYRKWQRVINETGVSVDR